MAKEIILHLDPSQTGLTLVAQLFAGDIQEGGDIALVETGTTAIYVGDMPGATPANIYIVKFIDTLITAIIEFGRISWNGKREINDLDLNLVRALLEGDYVLAGDPYFCECQKTARLVAEQLELEDDKWSVSFQSRFGPREWLKPYTDKTLKEWAKSGIEKVDVICPGFSADCLETLEEINMQNRGFFLDAGGKRFSYIPALNDQAAHISALLDIIEKHCEGWPETSPEWNITEQEKEIAATNQRAEELKNKL